MSPQLQKRRDGKKSLAQRKKEKILFFAFFSSFFFERDIQKTPPLFLLLWKGHWRSKSGHNLTKFKHVLFANRLGEEGSVGEDMVSRSVDLRV